MDETGRRRGGGVLLGLLLAALLSGFFGTARYALAQDVQVSASLDSTVIGLQDQVELSVTVSGKDASDAENPRFPRLSEFRIVSGPNVSSQFQWVNGRSSSSKSFSYILVPEREGQFTIPPIEVRVGARTYKTQPLELRVASAARATPRGQRPGRSALLDPFEAFDEPDRRVQADDDAVLVRAELDRTSAYPGQQVTLSYRLYTRVAVSGVQLHESPPLSGFWVEDLEVEKNPVGTSKIVNGREYTVYTMRKQALFATGSGRLKIPPSAFAISAQTSTGFFVRPVTVLRRSQELSLDVKPLPAAGRPSDFTNAVGAFNISAAADKTQVKTGEAVAFRVHLRGRGNLKMISDISLPPLPDFTVYSSKRTDAVRPGPDDQIAGDKSWEFVIVPKAPGRLTIPPISFSYFDTERNSYQTVKTQTLTVDAARGLESAAGAGLSGSDQQDLVRRGSDINFIKLSPGDLKRPAAPFYRTFWFYLLLALLPAFNVALFLVQRKRSGVENAEATRRRKAKRNAYNELNAAEREGRGDPRRFYDGAAAALSRYLSERFDLAAIELTGDSLERALSGASIAPETIAETRACLEECDFGRFVSAATSTERMTELSARIRKTIDALDGAAAEFPGRRSGIAGTIMLMLPFLMLSAFTAVSAAQTPERAADLFARGNAEYQKSAFAAAERSYREALSSGFASPALYYNLGNACFKQKRLGDAIYWWEVAQRELPADREVRENLELASLLVVDRIETPATPLPAKLLSAIHGFLTVTQELWLVLALFVGANVCIALYLLLRDSGRAFRALIVGGVLAALFLVSGCALAWRVYERDFVRSAIVVVPKIDVRSGPGTDNITVFTIHEGIKVRVHGANDGWLQISLPNGWNGWLHGDAIRKF